MIRLAPLIVLSLLMACGCERSNREDLGEGSGFIAVVGAGESDPLWPILKGTARSYWAEVSTDYYGLRVKAPPVVSVNAQAKIVRRFHEMGMRGLCIQIIDPQATRQLLESLRSRGVVVVTMVTPVESDVPFDHCGWSDRDVGTRIAETLTDISPEGGYVAMFVPADDGDKRSNKPVDTAIAQRGHEFKQRLSAYPTFKSVGEFQCSSAQSARAQIVHSLQRFPTLRAWVSLGNSPLIDSAAAVGELESALRSGKKRIILTDNPLCRFWPGVDSNVRMIAVSGDYGLIAPTAIGVVRAVLLQGGSSRDLGRIPLRVVNNAGLQDFRTDWNHWTGTSP